MKKLITIFLMLLYLFGATEAYQLFKIPLLVKHYKQHCKLNASTTVMSFLKEHYLDSFQYDADYQQDLELPFKTPNADYCLATSISFPAPVITLERIPLPIEKCCFRLSDVQVKSLLAHFDIFQPPKTA